MGQRREMDSDRLEILEDVDAAEELLEIEWRRCRGWTLLAIPGGVIGTLQTGLGYGILFGVVFMLYPISRVGAALMEVWEAELDARRARVDSR